MSGDIDEKGKYVAELTVSTATATTTFSIIQKHIHDFTYAASQNDYTLTATCVAQHDDYIVDCDLTNNKVSLTLAIGPEETYTGDKIMASLGNEDAINAWHKSDETDDDGYAGLDLPEITYKGRDETTYGGDDCDVAPIPIGTYTVTATFSPDPLDETKNISVSKDYEITPAVEGKLSPASVEVGGSKITVTATYKEGVTPSGLLEDVTKTEVRVFNAKGEAFTPLDVVGVPTWESGTYTAEFKTTGMPAGEYTVCIKKDNAIYSCLPASVRVRPLHLEKNNGSTEQHPYQDECLLHLTLRVVEPSGSPAPTYPVIPPEDFQTENGTVIIDRRKAHEGSKVTITVNPDEGYVLEVLRVLDSDGNEIKLTKIAENRYQFEMPKGEVSVKTAFVPADGVPVPDETDALTATNFTDLDPTEWYIPGIDYCLENGIMFGVRPGEFEPYTEATRGMVVAMLARISGAALETTDPWYESAILWGMENDVTDGTNPEGKITREQLVAMLYRYAQQQGIDVSVGEDTNILDYDDARDVSDWAVSAMQWACGAGLVQGNNGNLNPTKNATRAEIAAIFQRFCEMA